MRVRARIKYQIKGYEPEKLQFTYSFQEGSKWNAFYEPDIISELPWRLNKKFLNFRMTEKQFNELFVEEKEWDG
ncbi:MAG: hypothetical protein IKH75_08035 [Ruminococcus sp.]|nr:hypothetical protein [Ruminococcus sp.]